MEHTREDLTLACLHATLALDEVRKFEQSLVGADGLGAKLAARESMITWVLKVLGNRATPPIHSANIAARLGEVVLDGNSSTTGRLQVALRGAAHAMDLSLVNAQLREEA